MIRRLEESALVHEVADEGTPVPGQSASFVAFGTLDLATEVVFRAASSSFQWGIYASSGQGLRRVADSNTPIPGAPGETMWGFGTPATWGRQIAFAARSTGGGEALYLETQGGLGALVPYLAALPGGGNLEHIEQLDIDAGVYAFEGFELGNPRPRLYLLRDGELSRELAAGESFDGKTITRFVFALESSTLAVWILFSDSSQAIYAGPAGPQASVIEVPSLSEIGASLLALLLAGAGTLSLRRVT